MKNKISNRSYSTKEIERRNQQSNADKIQNDGELQPTSRKRQKKEDTLELQRRKFFLSIVRQKRNSVDELQLSIDLFQKQWGKSIVSKFIIQCQVAHWIDPSSGRVR